MSQALLIIDVQQALCHGAYAAFESDRVIERINLAASRFRAAGLPVVFIQHEAADGPLRQGSPGWALADGLQVMAGDHRVPKTATDSFHKTELKPLLDRLGVDALAICGLQSEFCVDTTTRRALGLGYPVTLITDAHSTQDNGVLTAAQISAHHTETLANITSFGPRVTPCMAADLRP